MTTKKKPEFRLFDFQVENTTYDTYNDEEGQDNNKFLVKMFGMDEKGKTYCIYAKGFEPFFYVLVPDNWKKNVQDFIEFAGDNPDMKGRIGKSPDEIYHLIEILSNLAIWGTGDPDTDLCEELQYLIYSFEWLSSDDLPVAASFDTSFHNDAMIVWNLLDDNWYFSKDRLKKWESRLGNIWVKEDEQSP